MVLPLGANGLAAVPLPVTPLASEVTVNPEDKETRSLHLFPGPPSMSPMEKLRLVTGRLKVKVAVAL